MYWEDVSNRSIILEFVKNYVEIKFNKVEMIIKTFQKYEMSVEYTQDVLGIHSYAICRSSREDESKQRL